MRVRPAAGEGDKLRLPRGGSRRFGGRGRSVIVIRVPAHARRRDGGIAPRFSDHGDEPSGAKVRAPTPDGDVTLTVPRRAQSGQTVRLKSRGVRRKNEQGDLYVRFLVKLPDSQSAELERAVRVLAEHQTGDVRAGISF